MGPGDTWQWRLALTGPAGVDKSPARLGRPVAVVDRLHAHVICTLLGVPHVAVDKNYGKLISVFRDYPGRFSTAHLVDSPAEARRRARALLTGAHA